MYQHFERPSMPVNNVDVLKLGGAIRGKERKQVEGCNFVALASNVVATPEADAS